jgi:hypothetical protein
VPPHFRGLLGYCCFTCRRHTWRRVHRKSGSRA